MIYSVKSLARTALIGGLITLGVVQLGQGGYIRIKAVAADLLITQTWLNRETGSTPVKPWPWADTWVAARIHVPRLDIKQFVMKDLSGESLAFGPGMLDSLPPGSSYNLIAGHRDTHFEFVAQLVNGDVIEIEQQDGDFQAYKVIDARVIDSRNGSIQIEPDSAGLMLVTCWPFNSIDPGGPLRYLVEASPVD